MTEEEFSLKGKKQKIYDVSQMSEVEYYEKKDVDNYLKCKKQKLKEDMVEASSYHIINNAFILIIDNVLEIIDKRFGDLK